MSAGFREIWRIAALVGTALGILNAADSACSRPLRTNWRGPGEWSPPP
jgi:hypothetical protein